AERGLNENTLLICFSSRGFPLGEHHRVGPCDSGLYSELTHVPLLIRAPAESISAGRSQALVQPADIPASILDFCGLSGDPTATARPPSRGRSFLPMLRGEQVNDFERACIVESSSQYGIVTPAWSLRVSPAADTGSLSNEANLERETLSSGSKVELFV